MRNLFDRLFPPGWFHRHQAKVAGFFCGAVVQLALAGLIATAYGGGLSDGGAAVPSVYTLY